MPFEPSNIVLNDPQGERQSYLMEEYVRDALTKFPTETVTEVDYRRVIDEAFNSVLWHWTSPHAASDEVYMFDAATLWADHSTKYWHECEDEEIADLIVEAIVAAPGHKFEMTAEFILRSPQGKFFRVAASVRTVRKAVASEVIPFEP